MRNFLAVGPNGWGKGNTEAEAVRNMKKAVPHWHGTRYRYETFECHPDTNVEPLGDLSWPKGHPPISLGIVDMRDKQTSNVTKNQAQLAAFRKRNECGTGMGLAGYAADLAPKKAKRK